MGILLILIGIIIYEDRVGLGNGFRYIQGPIYDAHIVKDGKTVVNHTIVDVDVVSDYIVGLRKPAKYLECENGAALIIRVSNTKAYFILNMLTGVVLNFHSKAEFFKKLELFELDGLVELDYSMFQRNWNFGDGMDLSTCRSLENSMGAAIE